MAKVKQSLSDKIESEVIKASELQEPQVLSQKVEKIKTRTKSYVLDLRIHSPASLGYLGIEGIDTAPALVRLAQVKGLDVIALTDYYSGAFIDRVMLAARSSSIKVIPGVVIRCVLGGCDDVVLSCLFPEDYSSSMVDSFLSDLKIPKSAAGDRKYLVKAPFEQVLAAIENAKGVALPSRMDKTPHRVACIPHLVEKYGFRAFDLAYADSVKFFRTRWPKIKFHLFSFSNANALAQVGSRIAKVKLQDSGFGSIRDLIARDAIVATSAVIQPRA